MEEGQKEDEVYEALLLLMDKLNNENDEDLTLSLFIALILKSTGIGPQVDECVLCGNNKVVAVTIEEGGFVCENCAKEVKMTKMTVPQLRQFRLINKASIEHYDILKKYGPYSEQLVAFLIEFLNYHFQIRLNSWKFYIKTQD